MNNKFTLLFLLSFVVSLRAMDRSEVKYYGIYEESLTTGESVIMQCPTEHFDFMKFIIASMNEAEYQLKKENPSSSRCVETENPIRRTHFSSKSSRPEDEDMENGSDKYTTNFMSAKEENKIRRYLPPRRLIQRRKARELRYVNKDTKDNK